MEQVSQGTKFYAHQQRLHDKRSERIAALRQRAEATLQALTPEGRDQASQSVEHYVRSLEAQRDLSRTILHCDMDMFYAAVELQRQPHLAGQCFAVGHGVLVTASYEARSRGVRAGMAEFVARALCPELIVVATHKDAYRASSERVMRLLAPYTPQLEPRSLDEAYLDVTDYCATHGICGEQLATQLRRQVREATGLPMSVGVAPNRRLAKIASDYAKPDGVYIVPPEREAILRFLEPLRVRQVPGIGAATEHLLEALQVRTCGDVWARRVELSLCLDTFRPLLAAALGLGANQVAPRTRSERRSVSRESTFAPTSDPALLHRHLRTACDLLARDLKQLEYSARTVSLIGKHDTFERFTRAQSCTRGATTFDDLYNAAHALLERERASMPSLCLRLVGVRASSLVDQQAAHSGALAQWLRTPKASAAPVECPVCAQTIPTGGRPRLAAIHAHMEACLAPRAPRRNTQSTLDRYMTRKPG